MKILGYTVRVEILLTFIFFITPFFLPLSSGVLLPTISEYYYSSHRYTYILLLSIIGILMSLDGVIHKIRRYNLFIGLSMIGVVIFPVYEFRILHDVFALIFFVGNAYIITYHSKLLTIGKKNIFQFIIITTLLFLTMGIINVFVAESIGMFTMSYFMFTRYSILELRDKIVV